MNPEENFEYLDSKWFRKLNLIDKKYIAEKDLFTPKLIVDKENKKLEIIYQKDNFISSHPKFGGQKCNKGIIKLGKLISTISTEEPIEFIKKEYIDRINEYKIKLEIQKCKSNPELNTQQKAIELSKLHNQLYEIPDLTTRTLFISEFIEFINTLNSLNLYNLRNEESLSEILTEDFYNIKKVKIKKSIFKNSISNYQSYINKSEGTTKYNAKETKKILQKFINDISLSENVKVKIRPQYTFSVNSTRKRITVPKDLRITNKRLTQIIFHELCVHMYRSISGEKNTNTNNQRIKILSVSKIKDLWAEEGLASYFEQNSFYESDRYDLFNLLNFYLRIIAVHLGLNFEPIEVYEKLNKLAHIVKIIKPDEKAKRSKIRDVLILRLYRDYQFPIKGCVNGLISQYLYGNRKIWNYINGGNNIFNLFAGKITPEVLGEIKYLGFNIPEKYMSFESLPREYLLNIINESIDYVSSKKKLELK